MVKLLGGVFTFCLVLIFQNADKRIVFMLDQNCSWYVGRINYKGYILLHPHGPKQDMYLVFTRQNIKKQHSRIVADCVTKSKPT